LQSAEFVQEQRAPGDVEYIFKHALTQEVAYNSLLIEHRKLLHERIAGAIESLFAERLDDHLKDLTHHYRRSNNTVKATNTYGERANRPQCAPSTKKLPSSSTVHWNCWKN
jgi:predicted ATPase